MQGQGKMQGLQLNYLLFIADAEYEIVMGCFEIYHGKPTTVMKYCPFKLLTTM